MSQPALILGASSGIARALCGELAKDGTALVVSGRNADEIEAIAADLRVRFDVPVSVEIFDALDFADHPEFFARCVAQAGGRLGTVVLCHGWMTDQETTEQDFAAARRTIDVNLSSAVSLLHLAADHMAGHGEGVIAAISSVAGDRGRLTNYTYGSTKAGLQAFLSGLRNRLYHHGVHVLDIRPGLVATAMTDGLVNPDSPLVATPDTIARDIVRALGKRKNVLYTPWFWRPIMAVIRNLPETVFKRLRL
jgi:short-subunit dehydrogenase